MPVVEVIVLQGKWLEWDTLKGNSICMFYEHGFKSLKRVNITVQLITKRTDEASCIHLYTTCDWKNCAEVHLAPLPLCGVTVPCGWSRAALPKLMVTERVLSVN